MSTRPLRCTWQQCSVKVTCDDLARMLSAMLANGGVNPLTGLRPLPALRVRDVLSVMFTCGMYDYAGEWAFDVGVPAKSGVSGGILAAVPGKMGIGTFSPGLDPHGNSVRGVGVCREVSQRLGLHLFAGDSLPLGTPHGSEHDAASVWAAQASTSRRSSGLAYDHEVWGWA